MHRTPPEPSSALVDFLLRVNHITLDFLVGVRFGAVRLAAPKLAAE